MNKLEVGMYVRNKYGIAKVINIENNNGIDILVFDNPICFLVNKETGEIKDDMLLNRLAIIDGVDLSKIKSSYNIIDLIEKGDYVNGEKIDSILNDEELLTEAITSAGIDGRIINSSDIKSIVPKEQFESMKYEVSNE